MPEPLSSLPPSETTVLGRTGLTVSRVGFGGYRIDDRHPGHREALENALAAGVTLIDTSTNYGDGASERLIGSLLEEHASEGIAVVTKAGYVQGSNQNEARHRIAEGRPWPEMTEYAPDCWHSISPGFLKDQLAASLKRLRRPKVDVFLLHNPEYFLMDAAHRGVPPVEAREAFYDRVRRALLALEEERTAGRISWYGISSNTFVVPCGQPDAVDLTRILAFAPPGFAVLQLPMNPIEFGARQGHHTADGRSVLEVAKAAGLGVLVNRPFNAFSDRSMVRFAPLPGDVLRHLGLRPEEEAAREQDMNDYLVEVFGPCGGGTTSQRTLRALLSVPGVDVVLVGMRRASYVRDVVGAFA
jgi:hypothetical protein